MTQSLGSVPQFPIDLHSPGDAGQSHGAKTTELSGEVGRTQTSAGHDASNTSLEHLCPTKRCLLLLGALVLLAGAAVGMWLLGKFLAAPRPDLDPTPLQDVESSPICREAEEDEPVVTTAPRRVSFRINTGNFLLEVQVEGKPRWLLACHEWWNLSLGTLICRQLGYLRLTHHKGVNLTDVKVNDTQEFVQIIPNRSSSIEDLWQVRSSCASGRIVALKCSECGVRSRAARIVGGSDAPLGRWPWQVSLYLSSHHICGGSVLAQEWIVTAAHCVHSYRLPQLSRWLVFAGIITHVSLTQQAGAAVEKIISHPRYDASSHDYDIALLKLSVPLNFSDAVRAVCLPLYQQDFPWGTPCWISGWGYTRPEHVHVAERLKEGVVPLISMKKCNSSCVYAGELTPRMLCAGYLEGKVDACQGDSGGPLVCQDELTWRLVGIVSWGTGCAEPSFPGVYTKVAEFLDWIYHVIESH
ncbi:transmembrane protease serine 5 [Emydura macquarii macquarii]|uniref:transmembrane protease serine 5 n=1 Tax=Emydura macquarii macquarii TaxID=1129001 RepID=UPI00352B5F14